DRVGDPAGIIASDGSTRRADSVLADGLRALAYAAASGRSLPGATAVTHPAPWSVAASDALRPALGRVPEWSAGRVSLISDAAAALAALRADPGVPSRGVVAVCDFGGSGTNITLVDAANGCQPIGVTMRHPEFCGVMIDQALLTCLV